MRSIILLLILVMIGLNGKGQSVTALPDSVLSQCCLEVTTLTGVTTTVDWVFIQYITRDGTGTKLFVEYAPNFGGIQWETQIRIQDDFDDVIARSKFIILPFTVGSTDYGINRNWIANIEENTTTGGTWIYGRFGSPTKRKFSAVEDYETMKNLLLACRPRAIVVAENGLYTDGDTVRMGGFLIEPTKIRTEGYNWQMKDEASSAEFGLDYNSPFGDTSVYSARRTGKWRLLNTMGRRYWGVFMEDTTGVSGIDNRIEHGFYAGSDDPYVQVYTKSGIGSNAKVNWLINSYSGGSWTYKDGSANPYYTHGFSTSQAGAVMGSSESGTGDPGSGVRITTNGFGVGADEWIGIVTKNVDNGAATNGQFLQLVDNSNGKVEFASINLSGYLQISDTSAMLSPYIRTAGWGLIKSPYTLRVDSTLLATRTYTNRFLLRSDTSSMLTPYIDGFGTVARIPIFTGSRTIGNSPITYNSTTKRTTWDSPGVIELPMGTTAQRPSPANKSDFWFNDQLGMFEGYFGSSWDQFGTLAKTQTWTGINTFNSGTLAPVQIIGRLELGSGSNGGDLRAIAGGGFSAGYQMWKDATPSAAMNLGISVPGTSAGNDMIMSAFKEGGWVERLRVNRDGGFSALGIFSVGATGNLLSTTTNSTFEYTAVSDIRYTLLSNTLNTSSARSVIGVNVGGSSGNVNWRELQLHTFAPNYSGSNYGGSYVAGNYLIAAIDYNPTNIRRMHFSLGASTFHTTDTVEYVFNRFAASPTISASTRISAISNRGIQFPGTTTAGRVLSKVGQYWISYNTDSTAFNYRDNSGWHMFATRAYARSLVSGLSPDTWLGTRLPSGDVQISASNNSLRLNNLDTMKMNHAIITTPETTNLLLLNPNVGATGYPGSLGGGYHTVINGIMATTNAGTGHIVIGGVVNNGLGANFGTAIGYSANIGGNYAVALGYDADATGFENSMAIGYGSRADEDYEVSLGSNNYGKLNLWAGRSGGQIVAVNYGTGAKEASDLSKTQSNYIVGLATDGTHLDLERKRDTTILISDASYNFGTSITTAQVLSRYNRVVIYIKCTSAATANNTVTLHTPDANLAQTEIIIHSIDDNTTYRNDINFTTNGAVNALGATITTYNMSAGQQLRIRTVNDSGWKYFFGF